MNELTPEPESFQDKLRSRIADRESWTSEELVQGIRSSIRAGVENVLDAAVNIHLLARRGKDVEWLIEHMHANPMEVGFLRGLGMIAAGKMLPEVLLYNLRKPHVAQLVGNLPIPEQRRLLDGEGFPLREYDLEGSKTVRIVNPVVLGQESLRLLFAPDGHVRDLVEQDVYLAELRIRQAVKPVPPEQIGVIKLDVEQRCFFVKKTKLPFADVEAAYKAMKKHLDGAA